jgi:hypothetical protein
MAHFIGQGPKGLPGGTSIVHTTPYPIGLGSRARDTSGYEYIYCAFAETVNGAQAVQINSDFTAQPLALTGRGPMGIACQRGTSDNAGWVLVYGRGYMQIATGAQTGGVSPSNASIMTTLSTSVPAVFILPTTGITSPAAPVFWQQGTSEPSSASEIWLEGVSIATDASLTGVTDTVATTSGTAPYTAHTGLMVAVWVNYPQLVYRNYGGNS